MSARTFPFAPRSSAGLELGDLIAIPCDVGSWGVLQVSSLQRTGTGARSGFGVGVLPWRGSSPPRAADIAGLEYLEHGRTAIEIFEDGGVQVVDTAPLTAGVQSNLQDISGGTVHNVWGWRTAIDRAQLAARDCG